MTLGAKTVGALWEMVDEAADTIAAGEEWHPPTRLLQELELRDLDAMEGHASAQLTAVRTVRDAIKHEIGRRLQVGGAAKFGQRVWRVTSTGLTARPDVNASPLWDWIEDRGHTRRLFNLSYVRVGQLRAAIESDEDRFYDSQDVDTATGQINPPSWWDVRDRYFTTRPPTVTVMPTERAPKFLQRLEDGEVIAGKGEQ